ncbi:hypothetical protein DOTSEDRAFT_69146 [Dothistroma septosporum NZE10]|uniref:Uncharacterized protein n=1 Tax=Dothistroma septosporum (strain NZE10 / CBS 128990) TaxID=675120 RepID=N1PUL5_DOTSN|nr:hypothetical protein DOTSEDRAFT_69146 [Dothistroma septosporum NZE10]
MEVYDGLSLIPRYGRRWCRKLMVSVDLAGKHIGMHDDNKKDPSNQNIFMTVVIDGALHHPKGERRSEA